MAVLEPKRSVLVFAATMILFLFGCGPEANEDAYFPEFWEDEEFARPYLR